LADRVLAILHQRLALPQTAIAALSGVRPETVNKRIRDIRQLLDQAGYTIQPGPHRLASLEDLSNRPPPKHPRPGRDQDSVLMICKPWRGGVRVNAGRGGGAPGREPYGGAGAAADVDQPVGGRQLRGIGDRTHPRAVPRGHPQRG
jgi:hypothetical protein